MKLQILSDIHLESRAIAPPYGDILSPEGDVIALCGDIGCPFQKHYLDFLAHCSANFQHVLIVSGNHEYFNTTGVCIDVIDKQIEAVTKRFKNVHYLNNNTLEIDGILFVGSTLWSRIPCRDMASTEAIRMSTNDYKFIFRAPFVPVTPAYIRSMYDRNTKYLSSVICNNAASAAPKPLVVLTHHAPSTKETVSAKWEGNWRNCVYHSPLPLRVPGGVRLWVAGHTHHNYHHRHEGYELISNQPGDENFRTKKMITL
jgi:hypothetical protein